MMSHYQHSVVSLRIAAKRQTAHCRKSRVSFPSTMRACFPRYAIEEKLRANPRLFEQQKPVSEENVCIVTTKLN